MDNDGYIEYSEFLTAGCKKDYLLKAGNLDYMFDELAQVNLY